MHIKQNLPFGLDLGHTGKNVESHVLFEFFTTQRVIHVHFQFIVIFFALLVFTRYLLMSLYLVTRGAAEAAAGRGSPPPPSGACVRRDSGTCGVLQDILI